MIRRKHPKMTAPALQRPVAAVEVTKEEAAAIAALQMLARKWPKTLWLFSANGSLCVMKKNGAGEREETSGVYDPDFCVGEVPIENDGGDF